jgi:hypothetical protein|tara:strand:+ start:704 stop:1039 length:336 start_codon:yes stop_codon:yes gene_type:complete
MKKYKSLFFVTLVSLFLLSCQSVQDGLTLKKKENTEQFLIEKKKPLIMPPDFDDLPQPDNLDLENEKAENESDDLNLDSLIQSSNKSNGENIDDEISSEIQKKIDKKLQKQ